MTFWVNYIAEVPLRPLLPRIQGRGSRDLHHFDRLIIRMLVIWILHVMLVEPLNTVWDTLGLATLSL